MELNNKGVKDHQMLPIILAKDAALVTTDYGIVDDNIDHIPYPHPGIICIKSLDTTHTLTVATAAANLDRFKSSFTVWHNTDWSCKYLEIDEHNIALHIVGRGSIVFVGTLGLTSIGFVDSFLALMNTAELARVEFKPEGGPQLEGAVT
jgi:hypothetical protein